MKKDGILYEEWNHETHVMVLKKHNIIIFIGFKL